MEIVTKEMFEDFKRELKSDLYAISESISNNQPKKLLKNQDLMEYLGCSYTTIETLRNSGKIPFKKVLGTYYYPYDEIRKVFEQPFANNMK